MSARPLVLLGAGGLAREAAEAVRAINAVRPTWRLTGVLDDDPDRTGEQVAGVPVLGPLSLLSELDGVCALVTMASHTDPGRRRRVAARVELPDERWASVVHPAAVLASSTSLGPGSLVLAGSVCTADVAVGRHVVIMPSCVLTHDDVLADGCVLAAGVLLAGGVTVGPDAYLGSGARVREGLRIGAGSVVGMGSVVLRPVPPGQMWVGAPARFLRAAPRYREVTAGVGE